MKKSVPCLFVSGFILVAACTKSDSSFRNASANKASLAAVSKGELTVPTGVSVSKYGFLMFKTIDDLEWFSNYITSNSHGRVRELLASMGVTSLGASKYTASEEVVSASQMPDYLMNAYGVVQVAGAIMKPIDDDEYLLVMTPPYLTEETYKLLASGTYNSSCMNRFATSPKEPLEMGLFDFIEEKPTGYSEDASGVEAEKPFLGWFVYWEKSFVDDYGCVIKVQNRAYYLFGIRFTKAKNQIVSNSCLE